MLMMPIIIILLASILSVFLYNFTLRVLIRSLSSNESLYLIILWRTDKSSVNRLSLIKLLNFIFLWKLFKGHLQRIFK